ncbi:MAG TPA: lipid II flippase MurJ [Terriglobales bacterium]|nr:lipid II flippase MurJ [Terriglobales bacterium]
MLSFWREWFVRGGRLELIERIRRHWNDPGSHDRRIATGFMWVAFFVFVGKLAGAAKEMAIAWRYGVSETVDAYVFVFNLVTWPVSLWFGVLTVVLVPLVVGLRHEGPEQLKRFRGELLTLNLLLGVGALSLAYVALPWLLRSDWAGLSSGVETAALGMVGPLSWLLPLGATISLWSAWTMACGKHRNTLLEALPAVAILIAVLLPNGWISEPLVWGTLVGYVMHVVGLGAPLSRSGEMSAPLLGFASPAWSIFWRGVKLMVLGQALMSLTAVIDQFFAAHLGTGAIATLNYANRIMALILGLGAVAISRATLPVFSEAVANGHVRRLAFRWAQWMFLGGLGVLAFLQPLAHWVVKLLFERGAFTEVNTAQVAEVLQLFLLQVPFYFSGLVMVSALSSKKDYIALTLSGIIGVLIRPLANALLIPRMGIDGIAVSAAVGYVATSAYMVARLRSQ